MRFAAMLVVGVIAGMSAFVHANDDTKWVAQCLQDNSEAKVSVEVVTKYCICMNDKMDENETRSITEWEKANPAAMADCEKVADWR
jgi:hypothetical protein